MNKGICKNERSTISSKNIKCRIEVRYIDEKLHNCTHSLDILKKVNEKLEEVSEMLNTEQKSC